MGCSPPTRPSTLGRLALTDLIWRKQTADAGTVACPSPDESATSQIWFFCCSRQRADTGANVSLFPQRYKVAEELITASVAVSTALVLLILTLVPVLVGQPA